jgi:hypothetical protein
MPNEWQIMPKKFYKMFYEIGHKSHPSFSEASSRVVEDSTILPTIEGLNPTIGTMRERERESGTNVYYPSPTQL